MTGSWLPVNNKRRRQLCVYGLQINFCASMKMSKLQHLKAFVNERLMAAAVEIFGAVEKTMMEFEREFYQAQEAVKQGGMLMLTEGLKQEEQTEAHAAVSQDVAASETEAPGKPVNENNDQPVVKQRAPDPVFQELQAHWPSKDEANLPVLLQGDAVASLYGSCSTYDPSPQSSQNQTVCSRKDPLLSPTEGLKSEEKDDYKDSEVDILSQPDSLDCGGEHDAEWMAQGGITIKSKERDKERLNRSKHVKPLEKNKDVCYPPSYVAPEQTVECPETRGANVCYVCGKIFTTKGHLKRHMFGHTGLKPHGCKECGRTFARVESLRVHTRIHTMEIPYRCAICGKAFRHRGNMMGHLKTHTGEKPHRCTICTKSYAYTQDLRKHMQIHAKKK